MEGFASIPVSEDLTILTPCGGHYYLVSKTELTRGPNGETRTMILDHEVDRLLAVLDLLTTDNEEIAE